jgi:hypothetical protein
VGGVRLHRAAYRGADVARVTTSDGMEDFVFFDARPAEGGARVRRRRLEGRGGLRLVGGVLEVLDTKGAPRLRVVPPYVVDAKGRAPRRVALGRGLQGRHPRLGSSGPRRARARGVDVRGCVSPGSSTTRGTLPSSIRAGKARCRLRFGRYDHASLALSDGRVIIVGGWRRDSAGMGNGPQALCEIFSPSSRTWAVSSFLVNSRQNPALAQYPSGKVLAVGGGFGRVQVFVPGQGIDAPMESVTSADFLTATMLGNGKALVLGGFVGGGRLRPRRCSWTRRTPARPRTPGPRGVMGAARGKHTATLLVSGKVLVAGGEGPGGKLASAEIYDPATNTFAPTAGPMMAARSAPRGRAPHGRARAARRRWHHGGGALRSRDEPVLGRREPCPAARTCARREARVRSCDGRGW